MKLSIPFFSWGHQSFCIFWIFIIKLLKQEDNVSRSPIQQLGKISFMFSLTQTPFQIQKLKLCLFWEEFILSILLLHTCKLSALLDMPPLLLCWKKNHGRGSLASQLNLLVHNSVPSCTNSNKTNWRLCELLIHRSDGNCLSLQPTFTPSINDCITE